MDLLDLVRIGQAAYGKGVYARRRFKKGTVIGEVTGQVIDSEGYDSSYCIDLGGSRRLEPILPFRFLNHSCGPNCRFIWYEPDQEGELVSSVWVEALQTIEPGEELTIHYGWPADAAIRCGCRSVRCEGWICSPAELAALQERLREEAQSH